MKLYCLFISFAIVRCSVSMGIDAYKRAVFHANIHLERASVTNLGLMQVVTNILLGDLTIEEISLLLAVPELADIRFLHGNKCDQEFLTSTITRLTYQPMPAVDDLESFEDQVLPYLGVDKTLMTVDERNYFLRPEKLLPILGTIRRFIMKMVTIELLSTVFRGEAPDFDHIAKICRLICLYRNIRFPDTIMKYAYFDGINTCKMGDGTQVVSKYKFVNNNCYELGENTDGGDVLKALLYDQVAEWAAEEYVR